MHDPKPLLLANDDEVNTYLAGAYTRKRKRRDWVRERRCISGSNNRVDVMRHVASAKTRCILRQARSNSDTRDPESARWEFRNTSIAAHARIGPLVYDGWYVSKDDGHAKKGLHMMLEYFERDLHEFMYKDTVEMIRVADAVGAQLEAKLRALADLDIVMYDLKPSNVVCNKNPDECLRIIDYGLDYCEWRPFEGGPCAKTPVLDTLATLCASAEEYRHTAFMLMMVVFSAQMTYEISQLRAHINVDRDSRKRMHPLFRRVGRMRAESTPVQVRRLRQLLRVPDVRDHIGYYNSRRNCGTRRTFRLAGFERTGRPDVSEADDEVA